MTKKQINKIKIKEIPNCPECNIPLGDCDCSFRCPACDTLGAYTSSGIIICGNDDCRVSRFSTQ